MPGLFTREMKAVTSLNKSNWGEFEEDDLWERSTFSNKYGISIGDI
jgi:hypothetical protein